MPEIINSLIIDRNAVCLYIDCSNILFTGKIQESIEISPCIGLSNVKDYFDNKNILINTKKTNCISFSIKKAKDKLNPKIFLGEELLERNETTTFLGLI